MNSNLSLQKNSGAESPDPDLTIRSVGRTDRGCVRRLNEDAFLESPHTGLWAVADGMGGHESGDFASAHVIQRLSRISPAESTYALRTAVSRELAQANEDLVQRSTLTPGSQIGATVAVLAASNGYYSCIWAGDSRVYLLRKGRLRRLTSDHSLVQSLIDAGEITAEEARYHSRSHVVTRAIGADQELRVEKTNGELEVGDRFLLCTDGLTAVLSDDQILDEMSGNTAEASIDRLIDRTLASGAPDNVTAVLIDIAGTGQA